MVTVFALQEHAVLFRVQVKSVMSEIDIFIFSTSFITLDHKKKLKNSTFVGNTGHFDNEVDFAGSEGFEGTEVYHIKPQKFVQKFTTLVWHCTGVFRISRFFRICRILRIFLSAGVIRQVENPR